MVHKNIINNISTLSIYISKYGNIVDTYLLKSNLYLTNNKLESLYSKILIEKLNNSYKNIIKNIIFYIILYYNIFIYF